MEPEVDVVDFISRVAGIYSIPEDMLTGNGLPVEGNVMRVMGAHFKRAQIRGEIILALIKPKIRKAFKRHVSQSMRAKRQVRRRVALVYNR